MNNMNNCSDQTREKLKAAYMSRDLGVDFTREKFDRIIAAAEQERIRTLRRRKMIKVALVSLILCAACSGLLMGLITWEDASADNDDETKIIKQGDNLVIGNGVVDGDDMVGVTVEEYETIEDLPEEIREKAHFIINDDFNVSKIKYSATQYAWMLDTEYIIEGEKIIIREMLIMDEPIHQQLLVQGDTLIRYKGLDVYQRLVRNLKIFSFAMDNVYINISFEESEKIKIETILDGLSSD